MCVKFYRNSGRVTVQCLSQELKKVRHMSHQAEKCETYVSPGETHV